MLHMTDERDEGVADLSDRAGAPTPCRLDADG